jgi:hypothetical protein
MPNIFNAKRRHHIPKMTHRVRNWPEYEDGLRNRGSLTFWVTDIFKIDVYSFGTCGAPS